MLTKTIALDIHLPTSGSITRHTHSLFSIYLLEYVNKDHSFGHAPPPPQAASHVTLTAFAQFGKQYLLEYVKKAIVLDIHC
jgi:hypothetical protein